MTDKTQGSTSSLFQSFFELGDSLRSDGLPNKSKCFLVNEMIKMPKPRVEICPQCSCTVNSSVSRLILDSCGHKKCRLCLLKEDKGCVACAKKGNENVKNDIGSNPDSPEEVAISSEASSDANHLVANKTNSKENTVASETETKENNISVQESIELKPVKRRKFSLERHITILPGIPQKYHCTICNKVCSSKMTIRYHNYCASKSKPFTCETCGKGFVTKSHFEYHIKSHTGILPYICEVCGKGFKQKSKLKRHSILHTGERHFVCQECGKTYSNIESLKSHQRVHAGIRPYVCQICSKTFIEHSNYKKHVSSVHKGEKIFMCDSCGKTFVFKSSLVIHTLMVHQRIRSHVCEICNKPFSVAKHLKRHQIVHSVVRPHSCTLCGLGFRRKDNFERHMRNNHPKTQVVIDGSSKQKYKSAVTEKNKANDCDKDGTSAKSIPTPLPLSPIPPSQTVDIKILQSIPKIVTKNHLPSTQRENLNQKIKQCTKDDEESNTSSHVSPHTFSNSSENANGNLQSETTPKLTSEKSFSSLTCQSSTGGSISNFVQGKTNESVSQNSCPPKKNTESYRAVPVINRSSNILHNYNNDTRCQPTESPKQQDKRCEERTNCVPTITRASECMSGSVITRNLQQSSSSVLKKVSKYDFSREEPSVAEEHHVDQPSLRKLLHDVKCCNGNDTLNLTNDFNESRSFIQNDLNYLENMRFNQSSVRGEPVNTIKHVVSQAPELRSGVNENPSSFGKQYFSQDYRRKVVSESLLIDSHFKETSNLSGSNIFIPPYPPTYIEYKNNYNHHFPHYSEVIPHSDLSIKSSELANKSSIESNTYGERDDCDIRLKLLSDISHSEETLCGVGQPVITGTKKVFNDVSSSIYNA